MVSDIAYFCWQLVGVVGVRQLQSTLDTAAKLLCSLGRLLGKLSYPHRKQSLSKAEKEECFLGDNKLGADKCGS